LVGNRRIPSVADWNGSHLGNLGKGLFRYVITMQQAKETNARRTIWANSYTLLSDGCVENRWISSVSALAITLWPVEIRIKK
jgi:hypothetical protein